jgi:hypothetical protein
MASDHDDVFLFLRKPAPDGPPGARVDRMTRFEFCRKHALQHHSPEEVAGPNALREELGLKAEPLDP